MVATELERKIRFKDFTAPNTSKPDIRVQFVVYELGKFLSSIPMWYIY